MTIKKRLFCSNILMIVVPAVIVAFIGLLCTALLWITLQGGNGMHLEDGEDLRYIGRDMADQIEGFMTDAPDVWTSRMGGLASLTADGTFRIVVTQNGGLAYAAGEEQPTDSQLIQAADGITGLELGLHETFDLILLDLMLPGMDGFAVCRRLREETDIPIFMVTARREDIDKIRGLGADDYIEKPFSPSVLVARIRAHPARYERLTGGQKKANPELRAGGLRLNTVTRRVFVDNQEAELKKREYELLQFLMLHPDMVFSREELYEKIWGLKAMGDNATVAVHINRIREKIEPDPSHPRLVLPDKHFSIESTGLYEKVIAVFG